MAKKIKRKTTDVAVIDIGSNSIRLVLFRFKGKKHAPILEKKSVCGLARGLNQKHPKLNREGSAQALKTLRKFQRILKKRKPAKVIAIGTAAMRGVAHTRAGLAFHRRAEKALGSKIKIISGRMEARLTAYGVMATLPKAVGVCGDLGGGSLELAAINRGRVGHTATLALGSLTLISESGGNAMRAEALMHERLNHVSWLRRKKGGTFFPIGGSWRAVARVMMKKLGQPVHKVHGFSIGAAKARRFAEDIARKKPSAFMRMHKKIRHRADVIPYAAAALAEIIVRMQPHKIVFSGHGVREGVLRAR